MRTALVLHAVALVAACGGTSSPPPRATPLPPPPETAPPTDSRGGPPAPPNMPVVIPAGNAACQQSPDCTQYTRTAREQRPAAGAASQPFGPERTFQVQSGNAESGPVDVLVQIKAGTQPFWHMHRRDVHMVVLAGTIEFLQSGAGVHSLEPGSYVRQPGGYKHTERCTSATDCVLYVHADKGFDVKPL